MSLVSLAWCQFSHFKGLHTVPISNLFRLFKVLHGRALEQKEQVALPGLYSGRDGLPNLRQASNPAETQVPANRKSEAHKKNIGTHIYGLQNKGKQLTYTNSALSNKEKFSECPVEWKKDPWLSHFKLHGFFHVAEKMPQWLQQSEITVPGGEKRCVRISMKSSAPQMAWPLTAVLCTHTNFSSYYFECHFIPVVLMNPSISFKKQQCKCSFSTMELEQLIVGIFCPLVTKVGLKTSSWRK